MNGIFKVCRCEKGVMVKAIGVDGGVINKMMKILHEIPDILEVNNNHIVLKDSKVTLQHLIKTESEYMIKYGDRKVTKDNVSSFTPKELLKDSNNFYGNLSFVKLYSGYTILKYVTTSKLGKFKIEELIAGFKRRMKIKSRHLRLNDTEVKDFIDVINLEEGIDYFHPTL